MLYIRDLLYQGQSPDLLATFRSVCDTQQIP